MKKEDGLVIVRCKDCQYFCQHYGYFNGEFKYVFCGHCKLQRVRHRKPDYKACENFVPKAQEAEEMVNKKYLSKKLLDYVLSLELIPEIREAEKEEITVRNENQTRKK